MDKPREFWFEDEDEGPEIHCIEYSAYEQANKDAQEALGTLKELNEILSIKLQRTVSAAYSALLEISAWLGIPDEKRLNYIETAMENVKFCAEHDLRHMDESQEVARLKRELVDWKETAQAFREESEHFRSDLAVAVEALKLAEDEFEDQGLEPESRVKVKAVIEALAKIKGDKC